MLLKKENGMIHERIHAKYLVCIFFCINNTTIFCELAGQNKRSYFDRKKIILYYLIYVYFINIKVLFIFVRYYKEE